VRASLEARTAVTLPVFLDHPSRRRARKACAAPQDEVVMCDSAALQGKVGASGAASKSLTRAHRRGATSPYLTVRTVCSKISVMTEITDATEAMPAAVERFVLHWGDMGSEWGVNRSVSQIHALLYLSERPLTADEIAERLGLARSNVSTSIKELIAWSL